MLLAGSSLRAGMPFQQHSMPMLTVGGLLGCLSIPIAYGFGYAVFAGVIRPPAKTMAAIILFCGIGLAIVGSLVHGMMWMTIRSALISGAWQEGRKVRYLWIIASVLFLVISILVLWSGIRRAIPLWLALLNPVILDLVIGALVSFSHISPTYLIPMAPNLAYLGFALALYCHLHSRTVRQPTP